MAIYDYPNYIEQPFIFLQSVQPNPLLPGVEFFKIIDDYIAPGVKENMYAVSTYGRVFNIRTGRELAQAQDYRYYMSLGLQTFDNKRKTYRVHRLVALVFIPKTEEDIRLKRNVVNHKDLCPNNNNFTNLEWMTDDENIQHAIENGANEKIKCLHNITTHWSDGSITAGEKNGMARLSDAQVHQICKSLEEGKSRKQACIDAGLEGDKNDLFLVSHILQDHRHRDISCQYNLPEARKIERISEEHIHMICKMLENGYDSADIGDELSK